MLELLRHLPRKFLASLKTTRQIEAAVSHVQTTLKGHGLTLQPMNSSRCIKEKSTLCLNSPRKYNISGSAFVVQMA